METITHLNLSPSYPASKQNINNSSIHENTISEIIKYSQKTVLPCRVQTGYIPPKAGTIRELHRLGDRGITGARYGNNPKINQLTRDGLSSGAGPIPYNRYLKTGDNTDSIFQLKPDFLVRPARRMRSRAHDPVIEQLINNGFGTIVSSILYSQSFSRYLFADRWQIEVLPGKDNNGMKILEIRARENNRHILKKDFTNLLTITPQQIWVLEQSRALTALRKSTYLISPNTTLMTRAINCHQCMNDRQAIIDQLKDANFIRLIFPRKLEGYLVFKAYHDVPQYKYTQQHSLKNSTKNNSMKTLKISPYEMNVHPFQSVVLDPISYDGYELLCTSDVLNHIAKSNYIPFKNDRRGMFIYLAGNKKTDASDTSATTTAISNLANNTAISAKTVKEAVHGDSVASLHPMSSMASTSRVASETTLPETPSPDWTTVPQCSEPVETATTIDPVPDTINTVGRATMGRVVTEEGQITKGMVLTSVIAPACTSMVASSYSCTEWVEIRNKCQIERSYQLSSIFTAFHNKRKAFLEKLVSTTSNDSIDNEYLLNHFVALKSLLQYIEAPETMQTWQLEILGFRIRSQLFVNTVNNLKNALVKLKENGFESAFPGRKRVLKEPAQGANHPHGFELQSTGTGNINNETSSFGNQVIKDVNAIETKLQNKIPGRSIDFYNKSLRVDGRSQGNFKTERVTGEFIKAFGDLQLISNSVLSVSDILTSDPAELRTSNKDIAGIYINQFNQFKKTLELAEAAPLKQYLQARVPPDYKPGSGEISTSDGILDQLRELMYSLPAEPADFHKLPDLPGNVEPEHIRYLFQHVSRVLSRAEQLHKIFESLTEGQMARIKAQKSQCATDDLAHGAGPSHDISRDRGHAEEEENLLLEWISEAFDTGQDSGQLSSAMPSAMPSAKPFDGQVNPLNVVQMIALLGPESLGLTMGWLPDHLRVSRNFYPYTAFPANLLQGEPTQLAMIEASVIGYLTALGTVKGLIPRQELFQEVTEKVRQQFEEWSAIQSGTLPNVPENIEPQQSPDQSPGGHQNDEFAEVDHTPHPAVVADGQPDSMACPDDNLPSFRDEDRDMISSGVDLTQNSLISGHSLVNPGAGVVAGVGASSGLYATEAGGAASSAHSDEVSADQLPGLQDMDVSDLLPDALKKDSDSDSRGFKRQSDWEFENEAKKTKSERRKERCMRSVNEYNNIENEMGEEMDEEMHEKVEENEDPDGMDEFIQANNVTDMLAAEGDGQAMASPLSPLLGDWPLVICHGDS